MIADQMTNKNHYISTTTNYDHQTESGGDLS